MTAVSLSYDWLKSNGACLKSHAQQRWIRVDVKEDSEFSVAAICHNLDIPFFIPIITMKRTGCIKPIWPGTLYARVDNKKKILLGEMNQVLKIEIIANESEFLKRLHDIASIIQESDLLLYNIGDKVTVVGGPLAGLIGMVVKLKPLSTRVIIEIQLLTRSVSVEIDSAIIKLLHSKSDEAHHDINLLVKTTNEEIIKHLTKHPHALYELNPNRFEVLVAELLADMGYDVIITPRSRDEGRDILAVFKIPQGEILTIVECKRFRPGQKVGIDVIERLLWVADRYDKASCAMLATTSFFTSKARAIEHDYRWRLKLKDFDALHDWLSQYGRWNINRSAGLWLPTVSNLKGKESSKHKRD